METLHKITLLSALLLLAGVSAFAESESLSFDSISKSRKLKFTLESETISGTIDTKSTESSEEASFDITINYLSPKVDYFFSDTSSVGFSLGTVLYATSTIQGNKMEVDYQYYFGQKPGSSIFKTDNAILEFSSKFTPYVGANFTMSNINFNNTNLNFTGIGAALGADYYWNPGIPISMELGMKSLYNSTVRTLTGFYFMLGVGYLF